MSVNVSGGRSLRVMNAASEDAGRYTCIVSNSAGEERNNFDLNVLGNAALYMGQFRKFIYLFFINEHCFYEFQSLNTVARSKHIDISNSVT